MKPRREEREEGRARVRLTGLRLTVAGIQVEAHTVGNSRPTDNVVLCSQASPLLLFTTALLYCRPNLLHISIVKARVPQSPKPYSWLVPPHLVAVVKAETSVKHLYSSSPNLPHTPYLN